MIFTFPTKYCGQVFSIPIVYHTWCPQSMIYIGKYDMWWIVVEITMALHHLVQSTCTWFIEFLNDL